MQSSVVNATRIGKRFQKARIKEGQADFKVEWSGSYPAQTLNIGLDLNDRFIEALLAEI